MIKREINDIKHFMNHLLMQETFDRFYLVEATVKMGITYHFDGHLNKDFYDSDTASLITREYCLYKELRPMLKSVISGKQQPLGLKLVLALPRASLSALIAECGESIRETDICAAYLNIIFEPGSLYVTTGLSYHSFIIDKTLEHLLDSRINVFLNKCDQ